YREAKDVLEAVAGEDELDGALDDIEAVRRLICELGCPSIGDTAEIGDVLQIDWLVGNDRDHSPNPFGFGKAAPGPVAASAEEETRRDHRNMTRGRQEAIETIATIQGNVSRCKLGASFAWASGLGAGFDALAELSPNALARSTRPQRAGYAT